LLRSAELLRLSRGQCSFEYALACRCLGVLRPLNAVCRLAMSSESAWRVEIKITLCFGTLGTTVDTLLCELLHLTFAIGRRRFLAYLGIAEVSNVLTFFGYLFQPFRLAY
jgi:hypothetical protein